VAEFPSAQPGAAGRIALIEAGAKLLGVSPQSCTARNGVVHAKGNSISYGEIVARSKFTPDLYAGGTAKNTHQTAAEHRLIGKETIALDVPSKVNGQRPLWLDAVVDDMVYAPPKVPWTRYGSKVISIDDAAVNAAFAAARGAVQDFGISRDLHHSEWKDWANPSISSQHARRNWETTLIFCKP
jgi:isoquinoline 1-oxidoreductase subunit beta